MRDRLRVFIVDDHALFVQGLTLLLAAQAADRVEVVGHTTHPEEAVSRITATRADVALIDLAMPRLDGVAVIRSLRTRSATIKVIVLTGADDLELGQHALHAGAHGYLTKSSDPAVLLAPLLTVAGGCCVLERDMIDALLASARKPPSELLDQLSAQELQLWTLLARGLDTSDLAKRMLVSERTAKRMISALLRKIHAANRTEAAGLAGRYGILDSMDVTGGS